MRQTLARDRLPRLYLEADSRLILRAFLSDRVLLYRVGWLLCSLPVGRHALGLLIVGNVQFDWH